jgi:hypothetical protein
MAFDPYAQLRKSMSSWGGNDVMKPPAPAPKAPGSTPGTSTWGVTNAQWGNAPMAPQPPKMAPPAAPPPAPPAAPTPPPAPPNFEAYYQSDPRFLAQNPLLLAMQKQIEAQYGWAPDGAGGFRQQTAQENPYSVVQQLARTLRGDSANVTNATNSRGLLFSGFNKVGQEAAVGDYNQRLNEAAMARDAELGDINAQRAQLLADIYPDYAAEAAKRTLGATPPVDPVIEKQNASQAANVKNRILRSQQGVDPIAKLVEMRGWQMDEATRKALDDEIARREAAKKGTK